ncbi:cytochrome b5 domain-containing protein [Trichlorobacter ammonificans]|uniref:Cytochrome B5 n=1 Tax=Trichlorobacter ammonificans TaxID=2916410 RepID=A0ABN8HJA8_9BACT|nr:cytochrome b5 domain-containing protein [Trichlorobacter ammonificans]CAH2030102.1 Cytochrome B5 [Trichlorobacter ammonificans]
MKRCLPLLLPLLLLCSAPVLATEEYAGRTGKSCAACHVDPAGGGELTAEGTAFATSLGSEASRPALSPAARGLRFVAGYLHLLTAILWFGTILYVHLVLKPAYASSGLPRGELRVGIASMAVMGITGIILTTFRVASPELLLHSRFGVLLLVKISLYLVMVTSATFVITVIGPRLRRKRTEEAVLVTSGEMSIEELSRCDGAEGRPALFAFNGTIYDATASRLWKQGNHMGRHQAGSDLTEVLSQAPHGTEQVERLPAVGRLVPGLTRPAPLHERVFFFMAYMNLAIVFLIVLILALWRWW